MIDKQFIIAKDDEWTDSAENEPDEWPDELGDEQCADKFEQRDSAELCKPVGPCVTITAPDGVRWDV